MRTVRRIHAIVLGAASVLSACAPGPSDEYTVDDYAPDEAELAEIERRQNVIVIVEGEGPDERTPSDFAREMIGDCIDQFVEHISSASGHACVSLEVESESYTEGNCGKQLCRAHAANCVADRLLEVASLPVPLELDSSTTVPPQSAETRAALIREALRFARIGGMNAARGVRTAAFGGVCDEQFDLALAGLNNDMWNTGEVYATTFVHAYDLAGEIGGRAEEAMLAVSDAQLSRNADDGRAAARSQTWPLVSRAAFGHFLLGGPVGIEGNQTPLCAQTPAANIQLPVDLLRSSGLSIDDLILPIDTVIAGTTTFGNVGDRLAEVSGHAPLGTMSATDFYTFTNVPRTDFVAAQQYLLSQHNAFGRSSGARLPGAPQLGTGSPSGFPRFASTSTPPLATPVSYSASLLRDASSASELDDRNGFAGTGLIPPDATYAAESLENLVDYLATTATYVSSSSEIPTTALRPIAYLTSVSDRDREGRVEACYRWDTMLSKDIVRLRLAGDFALSDVLVVEGIDGLRCATEGDIEGAPCQLSEHELKTGTGITVTVTSPTEATHVAGFGSYHQWDVVTYYSGYPRYFFLERRPGAAAGQPGSYRELAGVRVPYVGTPATPWNYCDLVPISATAQEAGGESIQRNPGGGSSGSANSVGGCAESRRSCTDLLADLRLPLEDELVSDGDEYEDSWRHYLTLASNAAEHADRLADEIISNGLAIDERAERAAEDLERQCGATVQLDNLFDATLSDSVGGTCSTDAACSGGTDGWRCRRGRCVRDPVEAILDTAASDADRDRLRQCLGEDTILPWVTLGTRPVCLWHKIGQPGTQCQPDGGIDQPWEQQTCPWLAEETTAGWTCSPSGRIAPPSTHVVAMTSDELGFFDSGEETVGPGEEPPCNALRALRRPSAYSLDAAARNERFDRIVASGFFDQAAVQDLASRLGWEARPGDFSTVTFDRQPWFHTGDARTAAASHTAWPCGAQAAEGISCSGSSEGTLFCDTVTCTSPSGRAAFNQRALRAVLAARVSAGVGLRNLLLPYSPGPYFVLTGNDSSIDDIARVEMSGDWNGGTPGRLMQEGTKGEFYLDYFEDYRHDDYLRGVHRMYCAAGGGVGGTPALWTSVFPWGSRELRPTCSGVASLSHGFGYLAMVRVDAAASSTADVQSTVAWSGLSRLLPMRSGTNGPIYRDLLASLRDHGTVDEARLAPEWMRTDVVGVRPNLDNIFEEGLGIDLGWLSQNDLNLVPTIDANAPLSNADLLNGMELICESARLLEDGCANMPPPVVDEGEDLDAAVQYINCVANTIERQAATTVFANVPAAALDAARELGAGGTYPSVGGEYGEQVAQLASGLVGMREGARDLAAGLRTVSNDIHQIDVVLRSNGLQRERLRLGLMSQTAERAAQCATSVTGNFFGAVAACANSLGQIAIAQQVEEIDQMLIDLGEEAALGNFQTTFVDRQQAFAAAADRIRSGQLQLDGALAALETKRSEARRSVGRAILSTTDAMGNSNAVNSVYRRRFATSVVRYEEALNNAKKLAYLARRAIEQRLGTRLEHLTDLQLVEDPARWVNDVCTMGGIDYTRIRDGLDPIENYADGYIGDYVRRLELAVEGYRLAYPFQDARDTTVLSVRDEIRNVRAMCEVPSYNLLPYGEDLSEIVSAESAVEGWRSMGCEALDDDAGVNDCIHVERAGDPLAPPHSPYELGAMAHGYRVTYGHNGAAAECSLRASSRLEQTVVLSAGRYRISWWGRTAATGTSRLDPRTSVQITGATAGTRVSEPAMPADGEWAQYWMFFDVPRDEDGEQAVTVHLDHTRPDGETYLQVVDLGALMLEDVSALVTGSMFVPADNPPRSYRPSAAAHVQMPMCEDTDGSVFRREHWNRGCVRLCARGYGGDCTPETSVRHCYWETSFTITQEAIEQGHLIRPGGFALGNFNYRIDEIGVNFVGTASRTCEDEALPSTCYASGSIPYSLDHLGPFPVRNHEGGTYLAPIYNGRIEHGRGLAIERYITNPITSSDQALLSDYMHRHFRGRPLTGNYRLRVWDIPGVNFAGIEDVQIVLRSRHWTRFE